MVPFGFSVSDFIAGVNFLIDAVHSLSDTNGAQADYKELERELQSLNSGLDSIKAFSLDSAQTTEVSAVIAAIDNCRLCVEGFVQRNSKFKSLKSTHGKKWSLATLKKGGREVQWAIWKKDDVEKFRNQVHYHSGAIGMLLATLQVKQSDAHRTLTETISTQVSDFGFQQLEIKTALTDQQNTMERICLEAQSIIKGQASRAQSLGTQDTEVRDSLHLLARDQERAVASQKCTTTQIGVDVQNVNGQVEAIMALQKSLAGGSTPLQKQMLQIWLQGADQSHKIIMNQQQMLAKLQDIHAVVRVDTEIPAQVLLSKPIILLDARGRYFPFHLELIDSVEAFIAVLKVRFKDIGLRKIEKDQFALEDTRRKQDLSLQRPWTALVRPGQHISMSMVFRRQQTSNVSCPSCGEKNEESEMEEVDCANFLCRITYRRIVEGPDQTVGESRSAVEAVPCQSGDVAGGVSASRGVSSRDDSVDEEMHHYTRVHILAQSLLLPDLKQGSFDNLSDPCEDKTLSVMESEPAGLDDSEKSEAGDEPLIPLDEGDVDDSMLIGPGAPDSGSKRNVQQSLTESTLTTLSPGRLAERKVEPDIADVTTRLEVSKIREEQQRQIVESEKPHRHINKELLMECLRPQRSIQKDDSSTGQRQKRWFWVCHDCDTMNNRAYCPERCSACPHVYCRSCSNC